MSAVRKSYGPLDCIVFSPVAEVSAKLCVVLCHGYGAPGTDLVPLGFELLAMNERFRDEIQFVFPTAPLGLDEMGLYGGRAWWPIDMQRLMNAIAQGEFRAMREEMPPQLPAARDAMLAALQAMQAETGLPLSRFVLGGFSQGAMLATDITLRLPESTAGLCIYSGTLLSESLWRQLAPQRAGLPVLQSHGRNDMVLPFEGALWLRDLLLEAGLHVDFLEFPGEHSIPASILARTARLLDELTRP